MKAEKKKKDFEYTVKVVIIGDSGVGKTNILIRFCQNQFKTSYLSTIGLDFKIKIIPVQDTRIRLQIWDTAGQQRFKNINQTFYKGAIAVILAYSIDDTNSFQNVQNWIKQINQHSQAQIIKFLVGNKSDLTQNRKIQPSLGEKLAEKFNMQFMEVSAKNGDNIYNLFDKLGELKKSPVKQNQGKRISLHNTEDIIEKESNCKC